MHEQPVFDPAKVQEAISETLPPCVNCESELVLAARSKPNRHAVIKCLICQHLRTMTEEEYAKEWPETTGPCFYCGTTSKKRPEKVTIVCVPCRKGIEDMKKGNDCDHEYTNLKTLRCSTCEIQFVICGPCTEVAGSGRNVLHTAPECDERDI